MSLSIRNLLCALIVQCALTFGAVAQDTNLRLNAEESAWLSRHKQVTLGVVAHGWPPFEETDDSGNLVGLGPDYLEIVTKRLGLKVAPKRYASWPDLLAAACAGDVDLLMNVALVPDRTHCLIFSRPYLDDPAVVIGKISLLPMDDSKLAKARVAVEKGTSSSAGLAERFPTARQLEVANIEEALRAVIQGKADVYVGNPYVASQLLRRPEFSDLALLRNADIPFSTFHFAVDEREKPFASAISKALATITDEQRDAIRARWLVADDAVQDFRIRRVVLNHRERDLIAQLPPLRLGFNATWDAISPEADGTLGGIAGEYARILEERLGLHFTPVPVGGQTELAKRVSLDQIDIAVTTGGRATAAGWLHTEPMLSLANVIVGRTDRAAVTGGGDLNSLTVATIGPGRRAHILRTAPSARIVQVDTAVEGLRKVEQGTVDVYVGDVINVNRTLRDEHMGLRILAPAGFEEDVVFAISPRHRELVPLINRVIGGLSEADHQRIRSGWLQLNVQYGIHWQSVLAWMLLAALIAGILTFAYIHVRRAIAGREQALSLIADLTRNLPGVVFKIAVDANGGMKTVFVGGNTVGIFGMKAASVHASVDALMDRFRADDRRRLVARLRDRDAAAFLVNLNVRDRWIRMSAAPRASGGGAVHWSGYWADATEEQAQLDALATAKVAAELAANTKATFLATMSHEIRTPMSGLSGLLELLSRSKLSAEQRRMLELAVAAARSLRGLLDDILDYSQIESGRLHVENSDMRPRDVLCEVAILMSGIAEQKGVALECHIDKKIAGILAADGARVRQIVINLMSNAIKFTEHGYVALRAGLVAQSESTQSWFVEVSDTGIGIPEEKLPTLFQPFVQAHSSAEARTGGSGLGLVIARRLAELMGGSLSLSSEVGRGTTARLELKSTVVQLGDADNALIGRKVRLICADAMVEAAIRSDLTTLGLSLVTEIDQADIIMTDEVDRSYSPVRPVVLLVRATPLATLSASKLSLACEPLLFTAVRDACLRSLQGDPSLPAVMESAGEIFSVRGNAPNVLVAEDDPTSQVLIRGQLAELGCRCEVVGDGVQALLAWESGRFDLIVTDMGMPRLDGIGLTLEVRRREADAGQRIPIIALTAAAFPEDGKRCLEAGMDDHLSKPASLADLAGRLRNWFVPSKAAGNDQSPPRGAESRVPGNVLSAFCGDADNLRDEIDAAMRNDNPREIERALHRIAGALACVGHVHTAQRIRTVITLVEADGASVHRKELSDLHLEVNACIASTVALAGGGAGDA